MAFLRLDRQGRDRPGVETLQADRLAGLLAIAVGTVLDSLQGGVDLGDQLALAVAGPKLDRAVGLRRGAVGEVRMILALRLEILERLAGLLADFLFPAEQLLAEIFTLPHVHERLVVARSIVTRPGSNG